MRPYAITAAFVVSFTAPVVAAEYYVVQDTTTKKCSVVTEKPTTTTTTTTVVEGGKVYTSRTEAQGALKTINVCASIENDEEYE